ncbi:hypothetical protein [Gemmatimonas aurantiaca]|uniref:hypothetical protein n=1 Tax=Gemmatimonas aurantiaca TaxID=173480 RepID=UPI00301CF328
MTDRPTTGSPPDDSPSLNARERAVYRELQRLDPQLSGLFANGHELIRENGASIVYMLAHAGRELSRGVINVLTGTVDALSADRGPDANTAEESRRDKFRIRIAGALQLTEPHGVVTAWFDAHGVLTDNSHFHAKGRDLAAVRSAFLCLSELLYGRLAPFFDASASLEALATIDQPTPNDADAVTALLSRPQLRRQFFSSASSPAWISLLAERGHFSTPPDRLIEADGRWRMVAWPEGDFLARMAADSPSDAVAQLLQVPAANTNPLVWGTLVDAALLLDEPFATQLAERITRVLPTLPPVYLPHRAVNLLAHLAGLSSRSALPLLRALLKLRSDADRDAHLNTLRAQGSMLFLSGLSTEWTLAQLDIHELQRLVERALPGLLQFNPLATFTALVKVLHRALYLLRGEGEDRGDWASSQTWCPHLETANSHDDVRAVLLGATVRAAVTAAACSPGDLNAVLAELRRRPGVIWQRVAWHVLAVTPRGALDAVEALIAGDSLLESPFGSREAGMLLRAHFGSVSPEARARFAAALVQGPPPDEMQRRVAFDKEWRPEELGLDQKPISDEARAERIKDAWQRRRLRLFHAELPPELAELASSLGHIPMTPTREEQANDEGVMLSMGVSSWGGPPSPKSVDELSAMTPSQLLAFLAEWHPDDSLGSARDARWSLNRALTEYATRHVDAAVDTLNIGVSEQLDKAHATALVDGIREAVSKPTDVPWPSLISALTALLERCTTEAPSLELKGIEARVSLVQSVIQTLIAGCSTDVIPAEHVASMRGIVQSLASSHLPTIGLLPDSDRWHDIVSHALNRLGGDIVRLLVNVGLWHYRVVRGGDGKGDGSWTGPEETVTAWVDPILTTLFELSRRRDDAISISIARQIEWVRLLSPNWVKENSERLFATEGGIINPAARAMVEGPGPWRISIMESRLVLRQLAVALAAMPTDDHSGDSLGTALLWRCVVGYLWGVWDREEPDQILELGFAATTGEERGHVYWRIFRALSDTPAADPEFMARALQLWRWRIAELKSMDPSAERNVEAEGLLWLLRSPQLDPVTVVALGLETLKLGPFSDRLASGAWERASILMASIPVQAFELFEQLLELQLQADYAYVPFDLVAPGLRTALSIEDAAVRERAQALIHRLGEQGHREFGQLLRE